MNDRGIRLLAAELKNRQKQKVISNLVEKLHVHQYGVPRKEEINKLKESDLFREELEKELMDDRLYQDCLCINTGNDSRLIEEYRKEETAFDAVAEQCKGSIINAMKKYKESVRDKYLRSLDINRLIESVRDKLVKDSVEGIRNHLVNDHLDFTDFDIDAFSYDSYGNCSFQYKRMEVTAENYEEYIECLQEEEEEGWVNMTKISDAYYFSGLLSQYVIKSFPEIEEKADWHDLLDTFDEFYDIGTEVFCDVVDSFDQEELESLIMDNKYLQSDFSMHRQIKSGILKSMPEKVHDLFPVARKIKRKFVVHIGPTNSGKTYAAVKSLKNAKKGIYLAPLRLLAFEQYEYLNNQGYPCSLLTGEEHKNTKGAGLQSSTIEMADVVEHYDIAVIDEAQMLSDPERGWAWTQAILGLNADEIHVCAAPYAEDIVIKMIKDCHDEYEIVKYERETPLKMDSRQFKLSRNCIRNGDALIVFSKRNVHAIAREIQDMGIDCSVIYGNLPYEVRQEETRRFREGETKVIVSTDAIGMGMNLPIKRIVFLEAAKYDGISRRILKTEELTQIAGRAGRLGIYDEGLWTVLGSKKMVKNIMEKPVSPIQTIYVGFPESLLQIDGKLSVIMKKWKSMDLPDGYKHTTLDHQYFLCTFLENKTDDKNLIYSFVTIPFDEKDPDLMGIWESCFELVQKNKKITLDRLVRKSFSEDISLEDAEKLYKMYDLAYFCLQRFSKSDNDIINLLGLKHKLSLRISDILKKAKLPHRKCKYCSNKLSWNYPYGICSKCHEKLYGSYMWN